MNLRASLFGAARELISSRSRHEASRRTPRIRDDHAGQYFYLGHDRAITRLRDGHFLYVDPRDDTVAAHLIARGYWEAWINKVICALVRPGDHIVEVGANVGYHTVALALKVGPKGSITAFEANPNMARLLKQSIIFNGYTNTVRVLDKAASDQAGMVRFTVSHHNAGGGHIYVFDDALGAESIVHEVEAVTLDSLDIPPPKMIRIDAEGSEGLILRGAERLLERPDVIVCMEWDLVQMSGRSDIPALISWLTARQFRFWRINGDATLSELSPLELEQQEACDVVVCRQYPLPNEKA